MTLQFCRLEQTNIYKTRFCAHKFKTGVHLVVPCLVQEIFKTKYSTLQTKNVKGIKREMNLFNFLPSFMLLFGHAKLHKKRRLSRKHKFLHAIYFFQCCYKYLSVFLLSLEHLFFPVEYAVAFKSTKSYSKNKNSCIYLFVFCIYIYIYIYIAA